MGKGHLRQGMAKNVSLKTWTFLLCRKPVGRKGDPLRIHWDVANAARSGKVLPTGRSQSLKRISADDRQIAPRVRTAFDFSKIEPTTP